MSLTKRRPDALGIIIAAKKTTARSDIYLMFLNCS